jgi:hypothetical protein
MLLERVRRFIRRRPELEGTISPMPPRYMGRSVLTILDERKLRRVLSRMLDENEFLGPFGIRALSRAHLANPYVLHDGGQQHRVTY